MFRNDALWKGLIEDLFQYFIPFFLPEYLSVFDLSRPVVFMDKELQQINPGMSDETDLCFVDKLVKVYTKAGKEKWVLIHIEVQGYTDAAFGQRMFTYFYRILDRYSIPITAVAIFTDNSKSYLPSHYTCYFAGTEMNYRFNTYKLLQQSEAQLEESDNPFATALLTAKLALQRKKPADETLLNGKVALVRQMYAKGFSQAITRQLLNFIKHYVNFAKPETATKFEEAIKPLTEKHQTMGLEEQILEMKKQEGRQERDIFFVTNLLRSVNNFSNEQIADLAGVTTLFVAEIRKTLP